MNLQFAQVILILLQLIKAASAFCLNVMSQSDISVKTSSVNQQALSQNPYELLKKMNRKIAQQKQQIQQYQTAFESLQNQKTILLAEKKRLQSFSLQLLHKLDQIKGHKNIKQYKSNNENQTTLTITSKVTINSIKMNRMISPTSKKLQYSTSRPFQKIDPYKSSIFQISSNITKRTDDFQTQPVQQYVPQPIRLSVKNKNQTSILNFVQHKSTLQNFNKKDYTYGQNMIESFLVLGPDISQFKVKRLNERGKDQYIVKPTSLYCSSKFYKQKKMEFLAEMAKRAFPQNCKLKKRLVENDEDLRDVIQFKPSFNLSQDYFIFTLKGDQTLFKSSFQNPSLKKTYLYTSNPNYFLFIVCMKLPDFIHVRDEKNYQKKQNQVWIGQKIYAIATYFPFFNIHTQALSHIHSILSKTLTYKIMIDNQNILSWNMVKNVYDLQKNDQITQIIHYFSNKKPDYNQVCYHNSHYFGTLPQFGYKSLYAMALFCCPVFFSNFSYEQLLLMITAIFCQKTLIFLSKVETIATLSALFLINLISPFQYSYTLLLNCDSQKIKQMIFQFPFAMICSIKKSDDNIEQILELFAESNIMRSVEDDAQYIVIDVDSNSILYHSVLNRLFHQCIVSPGEEIRQAYLKVNSCESKSFSLPKALLRENIKLNNKNKSEQQKRKQQIKKCVKQYQQKMTNNQTKFPVYRRNQKHENVLKMLTEYIQQFTLRNENDYELLNRLQTTQKGLRMQAVKNHLLDKFRNRSEIIHKFLQSQMYANYLDSILQNS